MAVLIKCFKSNKQKTSLLDMTHVLISFQVDNFTVTVQ